MSAMLWYLGSFNTMRWHFYTTLFILQSGIAERSSLGYVQVHVRTYAYLYLHVYNVCGGDDGNRGRIRQETKGHVWNDL